MLFIISYCAYISVIDYRKHRISNKSVLILGCLLLVYGDFQLYFISGLVLFSLFSVAGALGSLGGGDIKLIGVIGLMAIPTDLIDRFLLLLLGYSAALLVMNLLAGLSLRGKMALAPAICASFLTLLFMK